MKIGIIQQHNGANIADNKARLAEKITALAKQGAELIVLQELHNSLYFCQVEDVNNFDLAEAIPGPSTEFFGNLAKQLQVVIVTSLFERRAPGLYHNTAVVLEKDGTIAGTYRKMHIPDDPAYYEKFYFTPGDLGFHPIKTSVGKLGVLVCWDQWYPEAARLMALQGADLLIYPTAIGYDLNDTPEEQQRQRMAWQTIQRGHAVANGLPVITVNRVGIESVERRTENGEFATALEGIADTTAEANSKLYTLHSGIPFWGTSFIAGPQGELLYEAPTDQEVEVVVDVDIQRSEHVRRWWPFLRDRRIDDYDGLTKRFIEEN
jgi:Predicted amidohydrolase